MNKSKIITIIITFIIGVLLLLVHMSDRLYEEANIHYSVYLKGNKIGVIKDADKLYQLINDSGSAIKEKYHVTDVYPPTDLKVIKTNTYNERVDSVEEVYSQIESEDDFAILGYVITIKGEEEYQINVLNKEIFYNATKRFVEAFLEENEYEKYIHNTQDEIIDTGRIIENMQFSENISIKQDYISVNDVIYTNEQDLTYYLLFGNEPETKSYTVKLGDTIQSISDANQLNVKEFLIANTKYKSEDVVLRIGEKVNVTLIDPQLTFVYTLNEIRDEVVYYEKKNQPDDTKNIGYREITTPGKNGINRVKASYTVTNGVSSQEANVDVVAVLQEVQNQITTVGTKPNYTIGENPVILDGDWGWPTNQGYVITSYWEWRWGSLHKGVDISGAGNFGSPIYAVADGTVIFVNRSCPSRGYGLADRCGGGLGNYIVIDHGNGYYTTYGHMTNGVTVSVGQKVGKGKVVGYMGNSGSSTGVHLHFAAAYGSSNNYFNPMRLYQ